MIPYDPSQPLFSLHAAKCGGNSVRQLLERWFGAGLKLHYDDEGRAPARHEVGAGTCVHGHFEHAKGTGVHDYYPSARQLITVVREPFEIRLSWFHYIHTMRANPLARAREPWMDTLPDRLEEYLELLDEPGAHSVGLLTYLPPAITIEGYRSYLDEHFVHLGVMEDLAASMVELARRLGLPPRQVNALNRSRPHAESSPELRARYRARHELEYAVYEHALADQRRVPARRRTVEAPAPAAASRGAVRLLSSSDLEVHLAEDAAADPAATARLTERLRAGASRGRSEVALGRDGAEPTGLPALAEVLEQARGFGLGRQVLHTDGLALADGATARRLATAGLTDVVIHLCAGAASVDRKLEALDRCREAGLRVLTAFVLMRPGLEATPALARAVLERHGGCDGVTIVGRLVEAHLATRERVNPPHLRDLWPPPALLDGAVREIRGAAPGFAVVGREVPPCYPAAVGGAPLALLDLAPLPLDDGPLPERCDSCAARDRCPVTPHCPAPGYCPLAGRCLDAARCPLPPPLDPPPPEPVVAWQRPLVRVALAGRAWLARAGLTLRAATVAAEGLRLLVAEPPAEHELYVGERHRAARYFVAGRRYALSHACPCPPSAAAARRILALLERGHLI